MQTWIDEQARSKAAALAPVMRALAAGGPAVQVRVEPDSDGGPADLQLDGSACTTSEEAIAALQAAWPETARPGTVRIGGIGRFVLTEAAPAKKAGRLGGRVCLVTGAAQGFGEGIARELAQAGGVLVIADLNLPLAQSVARSLNEQFGPGTALAVGVDVGNETSVAEMVTETVLTFGGIDLLVSNAGVLRAGGLEDMTLDTFEFVTRINYTAFFLVTKYGSRPMKLQARFDPSYAADIVQINSKSGLEGSNRNFAYAGSKFGGIGLTQSFAMELVEDGIKVNSVCPGNFFDGPLWSDPNNGLFVQYLRAGKVRGAKTVEDVRKAYEAMIPMGRGCTAADVMKAIYYLIEQEYETGQALPVTGGQVMLH